MLFSASVDKRAFSLVELSIVLVILGLLTGGILAGQSLFVLQKSAVLPLNFSGIKHPRPVSC